MDEQELLSEIETLKAALNGLKRRLDESDEWRAKHQGNDWGKAGINPNAPHPNASFDTIESGGATIRQDAHGMQVNVEGFTVAAPSAAIYFVEGLQTDPSAASPRSIIAGGSGSTVIQSTEDTVDDPATLAAWVTDSALGPGAAVGLGGQIVVGDTGVVETGGSTKNNYELHYDGFVREYRLIYWFTALNQDLEVTGIKFPEVVGSGNVLGTTSAHLMCIVHRGTGANIILKDNSASSLEANRFKLGGSDVVLPLGASVLLAYDNETDGGWRVISSHGAIMNSALDYAHSLMLMGA